MPVGRRRAAAGGGRMQAGSGSRPSRWAPADGSDLTGGCFPDRMLHFAQGCRFVINTFLFKPNRLLWRSFCDKTDGHMFMAHDENSEYD